MSNIDHIEEENVVLVDALQSIMEISADALSVDEKCIHETAADALADLASGDMSAVRAAGNVLVRHSHEASQAAGWWNDPETGVDLSETDAFPYIVAAKLMLIVSEISEGMEGHRKGLMDDKLPHRPMLEVELADAVLRIGDLAGKLKLDLGGAIAEKSAFNVTRPDHQPGARKAHGGKTY